jgi:hypothetical protein
LERKQDRLFAAVSLRCGNVGLRLSLFFNSGSGVKL